jgi:signal transduction histidine kinase
MVRGASLGRLDEAITARAMHGLRPPRDAEPWEHHWEGLEHAFDPLIGADSTSAVLVLARDADGKIVYQSNHWPEHLRLDMLPPPSTFQSHPPGPPPGPPPDENGTETKGPPPPMVPPRFVSVRAGSRDWRLGAMGDGERTLVVGLDTGVFAPEILWTRNAFLAAMPAALLLVGGIGWLVSRRAIRPVQALALAAEGVTARGLDQRIEAHGADAEFARLITVFNAMLDRLERSFYQATRFSADAAHELRTPLTILQSQLEEALKAAEEGSGEQGRYAELLEEVCRLRSIVQSLLLLSRADAGQLRLDLAPTNLTQMAESLADDVRILAPDLTVSADLAEDVWVPADAGLLSQTLTNLATNAVRYNKEDGSITLSLRRVGDRAQFAVSNTGPGIPVEERDRVFQRFFRGARPRGGIDGFGLGLSLAQEIARAHGGDLALVDRKDALTTFVLGLPAVAPDEAHAQEARSNREH